MYTVHDFDELCFEFGVEYDGNNDEEVTFAKEQGLPVLASQWKVEIPANRCVDLHPRVLVWSLDQRSGLQLRGHADVMQI